MPVSFVAATDFQPVAPAPETFALASADITAFPRLFPFSLTALKNGIAGNLPGFSLSDNATSCAVQAVIQAGLIGGGGSVAAAAARASVIINQSCARQLTLALLSDAGA